MTRKAAEYWSQTKTDDSRVASTLVSLHHASSPPFCARRTTRTALGGTRELPCCIYSCPRGRLDQRFGLSEPHSKAALTVAATALSRDAAEAMPVRLVIRNFPPHIDAEAASAFVAQTTTRGAPVRCETLYYRRGKPKTKRGVRLGSLYVEGDNDEAIAEQLARAGPPPPPPPPPSDETQPPPAPKRPPVPVPLVVERAAFDRVFRAPTRPDRRAGTWLESPEYAAFKAYDPRQNRPKSKAAQGAGDYFMVRILEGLVLHARKQKLLQWHLSNKQTDTWNSLKERCA